ncbi:unnamed protein product, partial [Timema podura]|nr:unnamed protein product [Timema podura]
MTALCPSAMRRCPCVEFNALGVLPLRGEVNFPNIKLLPSVIDFGCVPIGTNVYKEFFVRNISPLPIDYEWSITDYEINLMPQDEKALNTCPAHLTFLDFASATTSGSVPWIVMTGANNCVHMCVSSYTEGRIDTKSNVFLNLPPKSTGNESKRWDEGLAPNQDKISAEITSPDGQQEALIRVTIPEPDAEPGQVLSGELLVPVTKNSIKGQDIMVDTVSTDVLKHRLFPLVSHFFVGETEMAALETLAKIFKAPHQVQKYFGLIPFYGHLPPFDSQIVSLEFRGNVYMKAKICAMIKFQGGPSEILEVTAEVGSIKYHIDKTLINFGMQ